MHNVHNDHNVAQASFTFRKSFTNRINALYHEPSQNITYAINKDSNYTEEPLRMSNKTLANDFEQRP